MGEDLESQFGRQRFQHAREGRRRRRGRRGRCRTQCAGLDLLRFGDDRAMTSGRIDIGIGTDTGIVGRSWAGFAVNVHHGLLRMQLLIEGDRGYCCICCV